MIIRMMQMKPKAVNEVMRIIWPNSSIKEEMEEAHDERGVPPLMLEKMKYGGSDNSLHHPAQLKNNSII